MRINLLKKELSELGRKQFNFERILQELDKDKKNSVKRNLQHRAKEIWKLEQIILAHKKYLEVYSLIRTREFYNAWCLLERIQILLASLKKHLDFDNNKYKLFFIEKAVKNLQVLFPYRLFSSAEIIKKVKECNICGSKISIRNPCGHIVGEIYNGQMCCRIVTDAEIIGIAMVTNPVNKFAVAFPVDKHTKEKYDNYNYELLNYYIELSLDPYSFWNLELHERYIPHENYPNFLATNFCPCGSEEKYENCCLLQKGVKDYHYEFKIMENHAQKLMSINPNIRNDNIPK